MTNFIIQTDSFTKFNEGSLCIISDATLVTRFVSGT